MYALGVVELRGITDPNNDKSHVPINSIHPHRNPVRPWCRACGPAYILTPMKTPTIGQLLYSLNVGNSARTRPQELTPVLVRKVGRKYFTCSPPDSSEWANVTYHLEDWREKSEYSPNSKLYESNRQWLDEVESEKIFTRLRETFSCRYSHKIPLLTLREIEALVDSFNPIDKK